MSHSPAMECCVCYEECTPVRLHICAHNVCGGCTRNMIRYGHHYTCPMCREPLREDYTIGVSSTTRNYAVLLTDSGSGIHVVGSTLRRVAGYSTPAAIQGLVGPAPATIARLEGDVVLYGTVTTLSLAVIDCFMRLPAASHDSRHGRSLRRPLEAVPCTMLGGASSSLAQLMRALEFPAFLVTVTEPPFLETTDTEYTYHRVNV